MQSEFFEWDDEKAILNLRKHGVDFWEAVTVFDDPYVLMEADVLHSAREERAVATGFSQKDRVLFVVYIERRERIRLVSARRATPEERRKYEEQFD